LGVKFLGINLPGQSYAFLFINHGQAAGRHYTQSALEKVWKKVRQAARLGPELRLYDATRHSFASNLLIKAAGMNPSGDGYGIPGGRRIGSFRRIPLMRSPRSLKDKMSFWGTEKFFNEMRSMIIKILPL
jgi:hypothetical protein